MYSFDAIIESAAGWSLYSGSNRYQASVRKGKTQGACHLHGHPYDGSIVNMGLANADGSICYIIGIRKDIRKSIGKEPGDTVAVTIQEREA